MSDALDYLLKIRPEAMQSYFDFLKQSTKHLDAKTRAIISVITKVDNQTETGFKQYLKRSLDLGVTPDEIIDALFMAFPTLGLSKIVWATNIILEMDLPGFQADRLGLKPDWYDILAVSDIKDDEITYIKHEDKNLFIVREGSDFKVYDSHCPHQTTNIPELGLQGFILTCPKHGWKFDLKTGECIEIGNTPLHQYENKVEEGRLLVFW